MIPVIQGLGAALILLLSRCVTGTSKLEQLLRPRSALCKRACILIFCSVEATITANETKNGPDPKSGNLVVKPNNCAGRDDLLSVFETDHFMKIGFVSLFVPGHLNPMTTLARQLQSRNHEVVFITSPVVEPFVRAAELPFVPFGENESRSTLTEDLRRRLSQLSKLQGEDAMRFVCKLWRTGLKPCWIGCQPHWLGQE
jgi:Glycosyltransferase family 28 N-terminal domain